MRPDWKALASAAYEAWIRNAPLKEEMHAIRCALAESRGCDAVHRTLPDAKCSLERGHHRNHAWTRIVDCKHPRTRTDRSGFRVCTACGSFCGKAVPETECMSQAEKKP